MAFSVDQLKALEGRHVSLEHLLSVGVPPIAINQILVQCFTICKARVARSGILGTQTKSDSDHYMIAARELKERWGVTCTPGRDTPIVKVVDGDRLFQMCRIYAGPNQYNPGHIWSSLVYGMKDI